MVMYKMLQKRKMHKLNDEIMSLLKIMCIVRVKVGAIAPLTLHFL